MWSVRCGSVNVIWTEKSQYSVPCCNNSCVVLMGFVTISFWSLLYQAYYMTFVHVILVGNCNPRFMRSTLYNVPCTSDMLKSCHIPFALSISPFAKLPEEEVCLFLWTCTQLENFLMNLTHNSTQHDGPLNNFYHHYLNGLKNTTSEVLIIILTMSHLLQYNPPSSPL